MRTVGAAPSSTMAEGGLSGGYRVQGSLEMKGGFPDNARQVWSIAFVLGLQVEKHLYP